MYKVTYTTAAKKDLIQIKRYIKVNFNNPAAAKRLTQKILDAADTLADMPYRHKAFVSEVPLTCEYRKLLVDNYFVYHHIDESKKL